MLLLSIVGEDPELSRRATVAVFDHGTGEHARRGVRLVRRESGRLGLPVTAARSRRAERDEAGWRRQRWRFLRAAARRYGARIVTAHTRDDRVETVVMRLLRSAGPRGLASLDAPSDVVRPLRTLGRAQVRRILRARGVPSVRDPANLDRRFLRVRVRLELLPAMRAVNPRIDRELLILSRRAVRWRRDVEAIVDDMEVRREPGGGVRIASKLLDGYDPRELAVLWPAIAGRAGLALDRRGTRRLAEVTRRAKNARIPLAGGWEAVRLHDDWVVRPSVPPGRSEPVALEGEVRMGRWRFREVDELSNADVDPWAAVLPSHVSLSVRPWRAGDRLRVSGGTGARRVKRFLADARIPAPEREGWPVVLAGEEIVWIPGVRRSDAATVRPGRPGRAFISERR